MKTKLLCTLLAALFLVAASGCAPDVASSQEHFYQTFTDDSGAEVALSERPVRVAVLFSSLADIWCLSGGEVSITVGETVERGIASERVLLVDDGAGKTINTELLLSYAPDFVIGSLDIAAHTECAELLRDAGIPTALFRVECFDDFLRVLGVMTDITGNAEAYARYGTAQKEQIDALLASVSSDAEPTVLFLRAGSSAGATKAKTAEQHFAAAMLCELGAHNIADDAPILVDGLSIEVIMHADPDLILITTMGDESAARAYMDTLLGEPTWQALSAVRQGRVSYLAKDLFQYKPNARWYEAYSILSELIYATR